MLQAIEQDKAGTIRWRVPEGAAVTNATYTLYDNSDTVLTTGNCTTPYYDTVASQTETGDYICLTMTAGVSPGNPPNTLRGQRVRCTMDFGPVHEVIVESVDNIAKKIYVPLSARAGDVASVALPVIEATIAATYTATLAEGYRIEWAYKVDGAPDTATTMFAVVKRVLPNITWGEVLDREPSMRLWLEGGTDSDWRGLIDSARELLDAELGRHGTRIYCIAERDQLIPLLLTALKVVAAKAGIMPREFAANDPATYLYNLQKDFYNECKVALTNAYLVEPSETTTLNRPLRTIWGMR